MNFYLNDKPFLCFGLFASLIALRDVFTQQFLGLKLDPFVILLVFFFTTIIFSGICLVFSVCFLKNSVELKNRESLQTIFYLGLVTTLSFVATIYGIFLIGAPFFSLIEHSLIPLNTLLMARFILKERVSNQSFVGIIILVTSVIYFIYLPDSLGEIIFDSKMWFLGILLAVSSSITTSLSSTFQKKLIDSDVSPHEILLTRFFLPSFATLIYIFFAKIEFPDSFVLFKISVVGLVFFTLPLYLLFVGFIKASLRSFSAFNLLIPLLTFLFAYFIIKSESIRISNAKVMFLIVGCSLGVLIFEWNNIKPIIYGGKR